MLSKAIIVLACEMYERFVELDRAGRGGWSGAKSGNGMVSLNSLPVLDFSLGNITKHTEYTEYETKVSQPYSSTSSLSSQIVFFVMLMLLRTRNE